MRILSLSIATMAIGVTYFLKTTEAAISENTEDRTKKTLKYTFDCREAPVRHAASAIMPSLLKTIAKFDLNRQYCFLLYMNLPSGKKRFFVYNIKADMIEDAGLVSHGMGSGDGLQFSNVPGSKCTSFGNYKVGSAYYGDYGLSYNLHGLDSSNSNAYRRRIVLHSLECIPETEVYPKLICQSMGCPMVSPGFFRRISSKLDEAEKPFLLTIVK